MSSRFDPDWLMAQTPENESEHVRHLRVADDLEIIVNSRSSFGIIMKPGKTVLPDKGDERS